MVPHELHLLKRKEEIEYELGEKSAEGQRHKKDELTAEYSELLAELERIDAGTWLPE